MQSIEQKEISLDSSEAENVQCVNYPICGITSNPISQFSIRTVFYDPLLGAFFVLTQIVH